MTSELTATAPRTRRIRYRLMVVAIAVLAAVVAWLIATLAGAAMTVVSPLFGSITVGAIAVVATAALASFAAWGVLALLERLTARAKTIWTVAAIVILAIAVPAVAFFDASVATRIALGVLHLAVGLPLIVLLRRGARTK